MVDSKVNIKISVTIRKKGERVDVLAGNNSKEWIFSMKNVSPLNYYSKLKFTKKSICPNLYLSMGEEDLLKFRVSLYRELRAKSRKAELEEGTFVYMAEVRRESAGAV